MTRYVYLLTAASLIAAAPAYAEYVPTKPIEIVVHNGPGSGPDVFARAIASALEKEKLVPVRVQVNNKPGGSGSTAMTYIVDRKGDNDLLGAFAMNWISNTLTLKETGVSVTDMTAISRLVTEPALIIVKTDSPYKTLRDFTDAAKKQPGVLRQAGGNITARDNVMRQLLIGQTGADWAFIPFPSGGERLAALLGGNADILMMEPQEVGEQVRAGAVRVLAQVNETRLDDYKDVPTVKEAGFDVPNVPQGRGIVGAPGMSKDAVDYYAGVFKKLSTSPSWLEFVKKNQMSQGYLGPAETATFFQTFLQQMRTVLTSAGIPLVR
jgi:putative tricarboxylic transport membrane protein